MHHCCISSIQEFGDCQEFEFKHVHGCFESASLKLLEPPDGNQTYHNIHLITV